MHRETQSGAKFEGILTLCYTDTRRRAKRTGILFPTLVFQDINKHVDGGFGVVFRLTIPTVNTSW
jgi:hypothetical protein